MCSIYDIIIKVSIISYAKHHLCFQKMLLHVSCELSQYPVNSKWFTTSTNGIRLVGKGSWKEREVGKSEVGKFRWSWKEPSKVGKNSAKLERTDWRWKEPSVVGKLLLKLESFVEVGKFHWNWKVLLKLESFTEVGKTRTRLDSDIF